MRRLPIEGPAAQRLGLRPTLLSGDPTLARRAARPRGPTLRWGRCGRLGEQLDQPGPGGLPVAVLGAVLRGRYGEPTVDQAVLEPGEQPVAYPLGQRVGPAHVEDKLHPGVCGVDRLPTRTARPAEPPLQLAGRHLDPAEDEGAVHGCAPRWATHRAAVSMAMSTPP